MSEHSYSFRVYSSHQHKLDLLSEYFQNASRNDLIGAAIQLLHERPELFAQTPPTAGSKLSPGNACTGILKMVMEDAHQHGRIKACLELVRSDCLFVVPRNTRTEFVPPYTMEFPIANGLLVRYHLSLNADYICQDETTGQPLSSEEARAALAVDANKLLLRVRLDTPSKK